LGQEYDIALKLLLQGSAKLTMRELTGTAIEKWLDVELQSALNLRLDLLTTSARNLQSAKKRFAARM